MLTLVRTSRKGVRGAERTKSKHDGMSQLIVDLPAPGVEVRPIRLLTGHHHFNEVVLRDALVPDEMLVGDEGASWDQVVSELAFERSGPERLLSTYPLFVELLRTLADPDDREAERTGRLVARLLPLRRLSLSVANAIEAGSAPTTEAALVKDAGTRFESEVIDAVRDIGRDSELKRRLVHEAVLSAPCFTLRGGTSEILRGIVARGLSGR